MVSQETGNHEIYRNQPIKKRLSDRFTVNHEIVMYLIFNIASMEGRS